MVAEQHRCVRHHSIFPMAFPTVSSRFQIQANPHTGVIDDLLTSIQQLSRLRSTDYQSLIVDMGSNFIRSVKSPAGIGELSCWGLESHDLESVIEGLKGLQGGYEENLDSDASA